MLFSLAMLVLTVSGRKGSHGDDAVSQGILTPAVNLRIIDEEEEDFNKGFVFEKTPEILTPGHITVLLNSRVENVKARAEYSQYLLSPTKFKFEKVIRCYAMVWRFIKSFKCLKNKLTASFDPKFQMFINVNGVKQDQDNDATKSFNVPVVTSIVTFMDKNQTKKVIEVYNEAYVKGTFDYDILNDEKVVDTHRIAAIEFGSKIIGRQFRGNYHVNITDDDVSKKFEVFV